jgi:hypothetical protein
MLRKAYAFHMPPKKKEMSPESRAKADQRNERLALKRGDKRVSGGGPKKRKLDTARVASTTEEEIPVSFGARNGRKIMGHGAP